MTLQNKRILITRPNEQADSLCELISNHGGVSVRFPTVKIQPIDKTDKLIKCFDEISKYDFIIFISRNAVKITIDHFIDNINVFKNTQIIAIGPGTGEELATRGLTGIISPGSQTDSKALLDLKEMQSNKITNKHILIIRGKGGRELLADSLETRGANINYVEVYKRCLPEYGKHEVGNAWYKKKPDVVVVTSNEILNNLISLLSDDEKKLFSTPLITMSERIAERARKEGFISKIGVAREQNDDGILAGLIELVED